MRFWIWWHRRRAAANEASRRELQCGGYLPAALKHEAWKEYHENRLMNWQPITTAPNNEEVIICGNNPEPESQFWIGIARKTSKGWALNHEHYAPQITLYAPEFWMPLPEPPISQQQTNH